MPDGPDSLRGKCRWATCNELIMQRTVWEEWEKGKEIGSLELRSGWEKMGWEERGEGRKGLRGVTKGEGIGGEVRIRTKLCKNEANYVQSFNARSVISNCQLSFQFDPAVSMP